MRKIQEIATPLARLAMTSKRDSNDSIFIIPGELGAFARENTSRRAQTKFNPI